MRILPLSAALLAATLTAAAAQERQWSLDVSDTDAYLAFGVPDTDDIGLSFWCKLNAGEIRLFLPQTDANLKPNRKQPFTLTIDGKSFRFDGQTTVNEMMGGVSIEGARPATDAAFTALAAADRFTVTVKSEQLAFPLLDADVQGLIDNCKKH